MRLMDLDPKWLMWDDRRIGFAFKCPNQDRRKWWLTCFAEATPHEKQHDAVMAAIGDGFNWLLCKEIAWTITGGIGDANFETISVQPSIDAGERMWHGHITNGEIV